MLQGFSRVLALASLLTMLGGDGCGASADATASTPKHLRLVIDRGGGSVERLDVHASTGDDVRKALEHEMGLCSADVEYLDGVTGRYLPLPAASIAGLPSRLRLRATGAEACAREGEGSGEGSPATTTGLLALPWRRFAVDTTEEGLAIGGRRLRVRGVQNSGQGTGHTTWDGAVVLAKYLERTFPLEAGGMRGMSVLETGAGTGLAGLSAALLGADRVALTDLSYTLDNLRANAQANREAAEQAGCRSLEVREADWLHPPTDLGRFDLILAADVVWLTELIEPFVGALWAFTEPPNHSAEVLMSYQSRSRLADEMLDGALRSRGFAVEVVEPSLHHPDFSDPSLINIFRIRRGPAGKTDEKDCSAGLGEE